LRFRAARQSRLCLILSRDSPRFARTKTNALRRACRAARGLLKRMRVMTDLVHHLRRQTVNGNTVAKNEEEASTMRRSLGVSRCVWSLLLLVALPLLASAQAPGVEERLSKVEGAVVSAQSAGDNAWMLVCAALVLMMTGPGLALFYGGLVRRKNVLTTMMQSFILMAVVTVLWALVGYSLAFSTGNPFIGGFHFAGLHDVFIAPSEYAPTIPHN